mgnify:CR=1 FL=1
MKRHTKSNAAEALDRQHQDTMSSRFESLDLTPGRDPAEGADIPLASPLHERWAQGTPQRDPTEGPVIPTGSPRRSGK